MCGIFALFEKLTNYENYQKQKKHDFIKAEVHSKLKNRGPDSFGSALLYSGFNIETLLLHTRLQINGDSDPQPIVNDTKTIYLIINGEIFNWRDLEKELNVECKKSDCEIVLHLYLKYKDDIPYLLHKLNGQYSFVLYDTILEKVLIARDHIGVTPLYYGISESQFFISSEMKCLNEADNINVFPPRHYIYTSINDLFTFSDSLLECYYDLSEFRYDESQYFSYSEDIYNLHKNNINKLLTKSVKYQVKDLLLNNSPDFGLLLSGGLDSSLIASLVVNEAKRLGYTKPIKTFSIGINSSVPDLVAARKVASFLKTEHHEYTFSIKEGLDSITDVIWYTESYDCTTIRASTPMYLLTKKIHSDFPKLKVLFSGELSDELFCYLYGANAPSLKDFQNETVNLVENVHLFDCLRSNKTCMANSIEVRVPFTDCDFVNYVLSMNPNYKIFGKKCHDKKRMEKQILRDSFVGYLPNEILYRKKEQFSDGVSGFNGEEDNWIDAIKHHTENFYTDNDFQNFKEEYIYNEPNTKEKLYFRQLFDCVFSNPKYNNSVQKIVKYWAPKWGDSDDPSGRIQNFWNNN